MPEFLENYRYFTLEIYHYESKLRELRSIYSELYDHIFNTPVLSFAGSHFDIPVIRPYLAHYLKWDRNCTVLKRFSRYIYIKTDTLSFIDITSFLPAGTSLSNFCLAMSHKSIHDIDVNDVNQKSFMCYDYITGPDVLFETKIPDYHHFFNSIKGCNSFEEDLERKPDGSNRTQDEIKAIGLERYHKICQLWKTKHFTNIASYVKFYCNRDVDILLKSCITYQEKFSSDLKINLYKNISLPSIARKKLRLAALENNCPISIFNENNKWIYFALKSSQRGGSSQVFNRFASTETKLGDKFIKRCFGWDCRSMYSKCLTFTYPCGEPISYIREDHNDSVFTIKKDIFYKCMYVYMNWLEKKYNISIHNKMSHGYEKKVLGFPVDGFISRNPSTEHMKNTRNGYIDLNYSMKINAMLYLSLIVNFKLC